LDSLKVIGRQRRIHSNNNCLELDKVDSRDILDKGLSSISQILWRWSCKLGDINDKLNPNIRELELRGRSLF
jgi:hypothetical protein